MHFFPVVTIKIRYLYIGKKKVYIYSFHTLVPVTESLWIELAVLGTVLDLVGPQ